MAEPFELIFKILLVGDSAVGKSSLVLRFVDDTFDEEMASTIGLDFKVTHMNLGGKRVKLTIWDTGGQERFRTLTSSYYRGAQGIVLVYDVTRPETFRNIEQWLEEVDSYSNSRGVVKMLVGNKIDKADEQVVTREQASEFARKHGLLFIECSAKHRLHVQDAFTELVQKIVDQPDLHPVAHTGGITLSQPGDDTTHPQPGCAC